MRKSFSQFWLVVKVGQVKQSKLMRYLAYMGGISRFLAERSTRRIIFFLKQKRDFWFFLEGEEERILFFGTRRDQHTRGDFFERRHTEKRYCFFREQREACEEEERGSLHSHGDHALTETRHLGKSSQLHEEVHAQF